MSTGEEITDLRKIKELALERKAVAIFYGSHFRYMRPAAVVLNFPLSMCVNLSFYEVVKTAEA